MARKSKKKLVELETWADFVLSEAAVKVADALIEELKKN